MYNAFSIPGVIPEGIRLYLFLYTLGDEARRLANASSADASTVGGLMDKTYTEAKLILDHISRNTNKWIDNGYEERGSDQIRVEAIVPAITMNTLANQMATVTSLLQPMAIQQGHLSQSSAQANALTQAATINYVQCEEGHSGEVCPLNQQSVYSIHKESFGNTYNRGWQNYPTFSWEGNHNQGAKYIEKNEAIKQSQASSLRNLEVQIEQLAIELKNKAPGTLPSSSGASGPRGKEQCQAVTLRSGKTMVPVPPVPDSIGRPIDIIINDDQSTMNNRTTSLEGNTSTKSESQQDSNVKSLQPPALKTQQAKDLNEQPIEQEDILANKRKIGENETVALTYECSALFQNNIPTKMKDPGSFTLPCLIGGKEVGNALCDLVANYKADIEVPIILSRLFLATGRALIDVQKGELTIRVDDQQVKFNILNVLKYPSDMENCPYVGELQEEHWHEP
ncbi:uncharacterized protein LOC120079717 [Benincasa hispida]|uniref:uncharacterized protein LOC120079717 n=1 Tax=Benincasa hispida TaxID=102211 RepID=UPI0019029B39|nr:uncharacterized protein LOC120079717 [Benincasa hispida]